LLKNEFGGLVLEIGRVAVFSENGVNGMNDIEGKAAREAVSECGQRANFNALHQNFDFGAGAFAQGPVDGDASANLGD
jgi:hypothetical protein